jgi:Tfp pilus assembly protein PilN
MPGFFSKTKKDTQQINLLPEREFAGTVTGRILSWIISTFRVIVIATEILVMTAFLSRFWLDAQNTDLNEEIEQKRAILAASQDFEKQFKDTQQRLRIYSALNTIRVPSTYISAIAQKLPPDVSLVNVTKTSQEIDIEGQTTNEHSAQQFVVNLNSSGLFEEVSLTELRSNQLTPSIFNFIVKAFPQKGGDNL